MWESDPYKTMVAQNTVRINAVNQEFRFVEGIWMNRQSSQIHFFFSRKGPFLLHTYATCSELPSYIGTRIKTVCRVHIPGIGSLSRMNKVYGSGFRSNPRDLWSRNLQAIHNTCIWYILCIHLMFNHRHLPSRNTKIVLNTYPNFCNLQFIEINVIMLYYLET